VGHLLHIRATVTLVSGAVSSASILFNAANAANGDSVGLLPQNPTSKSWTFGSPGSAPDATITASSSCISANCILNTASVPATAGAAYAWTINGGTITAGQGTHQVAWCPSSPGLVSIGVTVTRACSSAGSALVAVMPANILSLKPDDAGSMTLTFAGTPLSQYRFQAASSLSSPSWVNISTNVAGADGLATFVDLDSANHTVRFYRTISP
jgi:hypothetical protein